MIHLGYEVGTGRPVEIPLRHLAVTGQTQESGKTTTLEALVVRSGVAALAFVTKRGESSFVDGRRLQPYFRDRADWQFVTSIIDATLQEKNKFLRPWIMKICFPPGTKVSMADWGAADIENVSPGDMVRTAYGIGRVVQAMRRQYGGDLVSVKPEGAIGFSCTPEHPVLARRGGRTEWVEASEIEVGDLVACPVDVTVRDMPEIDIRTFVTGAVDYADGWLNWPKTGVLIPRVVPLTADLLRIIGLYAAEGCSARLHPKHGPMETLFTVHATKDKADIELIARVMTEVFRLPTRVVERPESLAATVKVLNPILGRLFIALCGWHSWAKRLHPMLMVLPPERQQHLVAGMFAGDGYTRTVSGRTYQTYTTVSPYLAGQMAMLLHRLGRKPATYTEQREHKRRVYTVSWTDSGKTGRNRTYEGGFLFTRVRAVATEHYDGPVHNLELAGEPSYVVNGVAVHNCRTTRTLAEVQTKVRQALRTAKGIHEGVYTQLDAYLDLIVPEIARTPLARTLVLEPGVNVMDVSGSPTPMQMLFVQSAIDWVNEHAKQTVVLIPEAWEFIPEGAGSPCKASAIALARKGAGLGNFIWVDSQDMAGVAKTILRGCVVWLIGVQREANEIKRNLANIPASIKRPAAAAVAMLQRGQFYACWGEHTVKVYVQPAWMDGGRAQAIARGQGAAPGAAEIRRIREQFTQSQAAGKAVDAAVAHMEGIVTPAEATQLRQDNEDLRRQVDVLVNQVEELTTQMKRGRPTVAPDTVDRIRYTPPPGTSTPSVRAWEAEEEARYGRIKARLIEELPREPVLLQVFVQRPELRVEVERHLITVDGATLRGRVARLIEYGFFAKPRTSSDILGELGRRGATPSNIEFGNEMKALVTMGFFTRENKWYSLTENAAVNVIEK